MISFCNVRFFSLERKFCWYRLGILSLNEVKLKIRENTPPPLAAIFFCILKILMVVDANSMSDFSYRLMQEAPFSGEIPFLTESSLPHLVSLCYDRREMVSNCCWYRRKGCFLWIITYSIGGTAYKNLDGPLRDFFVFPLIRKCRESQSLPSERKTGMIVKIVKATCHECSTCFSFFFFWNRFW